MKVKILSTIIIFIGFALNVFSQQKFRKAVFLSQSLGNHIWNHTGASTNIPAEISDYNTVNGFASDDQV